MIYVLDASVAFKWHVREDGSDRALELRDGFVQGIHSLLSLDIFPFEIAHSLTRAERQGRITPMDGALHLQDMLALLPDLYGCLPLLPRAYELSSRTRHGVHDCLYVALAEREVCPRVTADTKLVANLGEAFPFITALSARP